MDFGLDGKKIMKIGRNQLCHCGSGKKYKKCHLNMDGLPDEILNHFKKIEAERISSREKGIYINYVNPVIFKERKVWALGSRVYANRDPNETFHDFIQFILKETLGFEWISEQELLPESERHFLVKCFSHFNYWKQEVISKSNKINPAVFAATPNGWVKSMLTLAFDIATLKHASNLPDSLLKRLRIPSEYQGARYEIMIAAVIARLGFNIKWLGEETALKHCEFIATHSGSKTEIAVEAKSRHRMGVLHTPGNLDEFANNKGDVQRLLNRAFDKSEYGRMPFLVFIDINAPYKESENFQEIPWVSDILKKARNDKPNTLENPSLYNAIYFTNFSFHYQTDKEASHGQTLQSLPTFPLNPIPDNSLYQGILSALHHYGEIPDINLDS